MAIVGKGEMLKNDKSLQVEITCNDVIEEKHPLLSFDMNTSLKEVPDSLVAGVKFYDMCASVGLMMGITEGTIRPDAAFQEVPGLNDCDITINVYGVSMYPKYCSGEIVVCKETRTNSLLSYVRCGEDMLQSATTAPF